MTVATIDALITAMNELNRVNAKWPLYASGHEAIAVLREEYLELEHEIFHGDMINAKTEAAQVAAVAIRIIEFIDRRENVKVN